MGEGTSPGTLSSGGDSVGESVSQRETGSDQMSEDDLEILVEIVGAYDLGKGHIFDSDYASPALKSTNSSEEESLRPFCVVQAFGSSDIIHKTGSIANANNPIWTIDTKSLFILKTSGKELANMPPQDSLRFTLYGKRQNSIPIPGVRIGREHLGYAKVDAPTLIEHCDEERFELELLDEFESPIEGNPTLALRFRVATKADVEFVKLLQQREEVKGSVKKSVFVSRLQGTSNRRLASLVTEVDESNVAGQSFMSAISNVFDAVTPKAMSIDGTKKVKVKPHPDPTCQKETAYMTGPEIKFETMRPSQEWVEVGGGGHLGKLYLEVLSCKDLPNTDVGEAVGNVTDPFVCAIFEDAMVETPVIDDELNPHWLPWTQRAFIFNIMHPTSMLYLSVFDYDLGPLNPHEPIGRVAINLSHLKTNNTVYTLRYNLYPSSNLTERTAQGSIKIRLRIQVGEKQALLAGLKRRPRIHVNVSKEKSFKVARYTCYGEMETKEKFDLAILRSYINEILEYKRLIGYAISDSIKSIVFWRGQVRVGPMMLPIHSLICFLAGLVVVENPQLLPSFTCLAFGWFMLANMGHRIHHPSPWNRCVSFWYYLNVLWHGHSLGRGTVIEPFEGKDAVEDYEKAWKKRLEEDQSTANKRYELRQEVEEIGNETIHTEVQAGAFEIELLQKLGRWQGIVGGVCRFFRKIKLVLVWEDNLTSFWIALIFLGAGFVSLLLPWVFILTWFGRIIVWGFLGPHMVLVDAILWSRAKNHEESLRDMIEKSHEKSKTARLKREEAEKLRAMKVLNFGKYVMEVPHFSLDRHYDLPLPESSARVLRKDAYNLSSENAYLPGQQLYGVMIPRPEDEAKKNHELMLEHKAGLDAVVKEVASDRKPPENTLPGLEETTSDPKPAENIFQEHEKGEAFCPQDSGPKSEGFEVFETDATDYSVVTISDSQSSNERPAQKAGPGKTDLRSLRAGIPIKQPDSWTVFSYVWESSKSVKRLKVESDEGLKETRNETDHNLPQEEGIELIAEDFKLPMFEEEDGCLQEADEIKNKSSSFSRADVMDSPTAENTSRSANGEPLLRKDESSTCHVGVTDEDSSKSASEEAAAEDDNKSRELSETMSFLQDVVTQDSRDQPGLSALYKESETICVAIAYRGQTDADIVEKQMDAKESAPIPVEEDLPLPGESAERREGGMQKEPQAHDSELPLVKESVQQELEVNESKPPLVEESVLQELHVDESELPLVEEAVQQELQVDESKLLLVEETARR